MHKKLKIFIVDDHDIFRKSLRMIVNRIFSNCLINEAINGKDFLQKINNDADLIFMDIRMPEMDGIDATKQALEKFPNLKILGISMYSDYEIIKSFENAGAKGFIVKGGNINEIKLASEKILNGGKYFQNF